MAKATEVQTNYTGGEWSPTALGRADLARYANAVAKLLNFIQLEQGGALHRSGYRFVTETKISSRKSRLIEFEFSTVQSYILEFGDLYIRFYREEGQIQDGGGVPIEVVTPYSESELSGLKFTQSADILFLCHPNHPPKELTRTSDVDWTLTDFDFRDGPYDAINTTAITLNPSATSGAITIDASDPVFSLEDADGGRLVRILHGSTWGYAKITGFISDVEVNADVKETFGAANASATWRLGAWGDETLDHPIGSASWPHTKTFHDERLWFGGSNQRPQTLWSSVVGDFNNLQPTQTDGSVADDDSVVRTISGNQVNAIRWMVSHAKGLAIGTSGRELIATSGSTIDVITPLRFVVDPQTHWGSQPNVQPHLIGNTVVYVQAGGTIVREFAFNFEADTFLSNKLTLLANHITEGGIVDSAYQRIPNSILWLVRADGTLLGVTIERDQGIVGWHRHELGGSDNGSDFGIVESVAVIRREINDQVWVIVRRTINGATRRYIEFLEDDFGISSLQEDAFFVDSGLTYDGIPATVISGLDHIEGESATVIVDGATHPNRTVVGGQITLDAPASKVHVGLYRPAEIQSLPLIPEGLPFDPRERLKSIYKIILRFFQTIGGTLDDDSDDPEALIFRDPDDLLGVPPALFTGLIEVPFPTGYDRTRQFKIIQNDALPMTVLLTTAQMEIGDL